MYEVPKIDVFDFGALHFVIEVVFSFEVLTDTGTVYIFEINLN